MALLCTLTVLEPTEAHSGGLHLPGGLGSPFHEAPQPCFLLVGMALLCIRCHLGLPVPSLARFLLKKRMVGVGGRALGGQAEWQPGAAVSFA